MNAAASATPLVGDGPIGRSAIWAQLLDYLDRDTGAVVLLTGEPGSGRSHVLRKFGERASERGRQAIGCAGGLGIEKTTKPADIVRVFAALLKRAEPPPSLVRAHEPNRLITRLSRGLSELYGFEKDVFAMFDEAAPLVVGIDGYDPSPLIDQWFRTRLLPRIRSAHTGTLLVITAQPTTVAPLRAGATTTVDLGPLDRGEVIERLMALGSRLDPPIGEGEAAGYYDAVARDARVMRSLTTVLTAAAAEA